jgi:hypothetical protein
MKITIPKHIDLSKVTQEASERQISNADKVLALPGCQDRNPLLVATNGKILAAVESIGTHDYVDAPTFLPASFCRSGNNEPVITAGSSSGIHRRLADSHIIRTAACKSGAFPAVGQVMPKIKETTIAVTLDADLLRDLAHAISDGVVTLFVDKGDEPIAVYGRSVDGDVKGVGVIMPSSQHSTHRDIVDVEVRYQLIADRLPSTTVEVSIHTSPEPTCSPPAVQSSDRICSVLGPQIAMDSRRHACGRLP